MTRKIVLVLLFVLITLGLVFIAVVSQHPAKEEIITCYNSQGKLIGTTGRVCAEFYRSALIHLRK